MLRTLIPCLCRVHCQNVANVNSMPLQSSLPKCCKCCKCSTMLLYSYAHFIAKLLLNVEECCCLYYRPHNNKLVVDVVGKLLLARQWRSSTAWRRGRGGSDYITQFDASGKLCSKLHSRLRNPEQAMKNGGDLRRWELLRFILPTELLFTINKTRTLLTAISPVICFSSKYKKMG